MSQAQLAQAARMSRPNLSAVERGDREVTLRTLRQLALALDVRPGVLADGIAPAAAARPLGRLALERIAGAAARRVAPTGGESRDRAGEARLTALLTRAAAARLASVAAPPGRGRRSASRGPSRGGDRAYLLLKSATSSETVGTLVDRLAGPSSGDR
jgi:transcriptional regulator with XRE-family HTH domain